MVARPFTIRTCCRAGTQSLSGQKLQQNKVIKMIEEYAGLRTTYLLRSYITVNFNYCLESG